MDASQRSNVSVNSWMDDGKQMQDRRQSLMDTATRLGRRLVSMDNRAERKRLVKVARVSGLGGGTWERRENPPMRF